MLVRREDLEKLDVRLCLRCLERYTQPCAVVVVEKGARGVWHIVLVCYYNLLGAVVYEAMRCCSRRKWLGSLVLARSSPWASSFCLPFYRGKDDWRGAIVVGPSALFDEEFVDHLLQRYPALREKLLTERALRKAGCDLEAEIAMWQLGGAV